MSNNLHNLPALDKNHNLRNLNEAGQWMSLEIDLDSLAKALPVDKETAFSDQNEPIRAIPDPWAQATAFGYALRYETHSLHKMAVSQWRGLLAILALQYQHRGDFSLVPVAVDLSDNSPFAKVMTTLTPEVAIAGEAGLWRTPSVLMLRAANDPNGLFEQPLAMTNPICLVSPGRSSATMVVPKIDWAQGRLHCPLEPGSPPRSIAELSILHVFLSKLAEEVSRPRSSLGRDPVATDIAKLLYAYVADVGRHLGREPLKAMEVENVQNTLPALFRPLFNMVPLSDDPGGTLTEAEVMIPTPAGQDGLIKGYILADPAVATALGRDESQVLVWKNNSLADVLRSPAKFEDVRKAALEEGYILLTIDDVLTDRAVRFKRKALIETHPAGLQEMLLPLRPMALLVSQADGGRSLSDVLRDRTRGQVAGDRASFTFSMRLKSSAGDGVRVDLTRHYSANPTANPANPGQAEGHLVDCEDWDIYNCQLWPNFRSKAWHSYMARFYYRAALQSKMARPQQALSARLLHDVIAQASDTGNADNALRACNRGEPLVDRRYGEALPLLKSAHRLTAKNNSFYEEVQFSTAPFDAIFYVDSFGDERAQKPVGMVLLSVEEKEAPKQRTKVAIDFGTTNTVGAFGTGTAEPVVFKNRLIFPVKPADQIVREQAIHASRNQFVGFLPPEIRRTPIPSVAKPKHPYRHEETLWAFRNLIYFHTSQPPSPGAEERELADFLEATRDAKFNLKWSKDTEVRDAAEDFLTQFIVLTAAELFETDNDPASSKWLFSIPESLEDTQRDRFTDNIEKSMRAVGMDVRKLGGGGEDSRNRSDYIADLQSEGLSAANYMLTSGGFASDRLSIILDIGGGTTDMTIWERKTPRWKGSIKLAGGNFFTELLVNNTQILTGIGLDSWAKSLNASASEFSGDKEVKKRQMAEMLFSGRSNDNNGPDLQASMRDHWSRLTSQMGDPLRHVALTYLAGIAYYNGLVVRQLIDRDGGQVSAAMAQDPAFAVCGRGGGLFAMLHGSRGPGDRTEITRALSVFAKALHNDECQHPRFSASPAPKLEVVRGMLTDHGDIDTTAMGMAGLGSLQPLGLALYTANGPVEATDLLTFETLNHRIDGVDLMEFRRFLAALEDCAGIAIDITAEGKRENAERDIEGATLSALEKMAAEIAKTPQVQRKKIVLEPPFLVALRELIKIMAGPVDTRNAKLTIWGED